MEGPKVPCKAQRNREAPGRRGKGSEEGAPSPVWVSGDGSGKF